MNDYILDRLHNLKRTGGAVNDNQKRIKEIKERLVNATRGGAVELWTQPTLEDWGNWFMETIKNELHYREQADSDSEAHNLRLHVVRKDTADGSIVIAITGNGSAAKINAELMANAPADIAYLLEDRERLQRQLDAFIDAANEILEDVGEILPYEEVSREALEKLRAAKGETEK
jgi:hypothetical protein